MNVPQYSLSRYFKKAFLYVFQPEKNLRVDWAVTCRRMPEKRLEMWKTRIIVENDWTATYANSAKRRNYTDINNCTSQALDRQPHAPSPRIPLKIPRRPRRFSPTTSSISQPNTIRQSIISIVFIHSLSNKVTKLISIVSDAWPKIPCEIAFNNSSNERICLNYFISIPLLVKAIYSICVGIFITSLII